MAKHLTKFSPGTKFEDRLASLKHRRGGAYLMTVIVKVAEAKTHLSQLLARVEAGEEIIIARGSDPIARMTRIEKASDLEAVLAEARAARGRAKPVTRDEVLAWRREGARGG